MRRPGYPSTKPHEQGERTVNRGGAWAMPRAEFELVPRPSPVGPAVASRRAHPPADSASAVRAARTAARAALESGATFIEVEMPSASISSVFISGERSPLGGDRAGRPAAGRPVLL